MINEVYMWIASLVEFNEKAWLAWKAEIKDRKITITRFKLPLRDNESINGIYCEVHVIFLALSLLLMLSQKN